MFEYLPVSAVVVLAGIAGSGKSTWARQWFEGTHILSSDAMRGVLTDDETHLECSSDAFTMLEELAALRLKYGRRVVIDATNLRRDARRRWWELAKRARVPVILIYFDIPTEVCAARQQGRRRKVPVGAIVRQAERMAELPVEVLEEPWDAIGRVHIGLGERLEGEPGFEVVRAWRPPRVSPVGRTGVRLQTDQLDVIGDIHGCFDELVELLGRLGWARGEGGRWSHPEDRLLVFVGDLTDRGPNSIGVLVVVSELVEQEKAVLILGNHDDKLLRWLQGRKVQETHGLESTTTELRGLDEPRREALRHRAIDLLQGAALWALAAPAPHATAELSERLVVAHAAWKPALLSTSEGKQRSFCIYGPTTGHLNPDGMPQRLDWTAEYPAEGPLCVHGHTAYDGPVVRRNNTLCLDTGCVFGGRLSALRWPSGEIVQVEARATYYKRDKALKDHPDLLSTDDTGPGEELPPSGAAAEPGGAAEAALAAPLGVGPSARFDLRADRLLARLFTEPEPLLRAVEADPLLLRKAPEGFGGATVRLANASKELFSPQSVHHLYAKGLVYRSDRWQPLSVPYLKMYNYGEREDARDLANSLAAAEGVDVVFNEKLDGTMIQSFSTWGADLGAPRVVLTTRGMIEGAAPPLEPDPGGLIEPADDAVRGFDYIGEARRLLGVCAPAALDPARHAGRTLLWELLHPAARIVTDYGEREEIVLTGAIDLDARPPRYLSRAELEALAADLGAPITPRLALEGDSLDARLRALEAYLAGTDREGSVLTFEGRDDWGRPAVLHRVKVKGADYIRIMRQLTYCTFERARTLLDAHPDVRTWDAFRELLMQLGSEEVPEEVLGAWRQHFLVYAAYLDRLGVLAADVLAWFARWCERHPAPSRAESPTQYGQWRRALAHFVTTHAKELGWLVFVAADGRLDVDHLNKRFRGDGRRLDETTAAWRALVPALTDALDAAPGA